MKRSTYCLSAVIATACSLATGTAATLASDSAAAAAYNSGWLNGSNGGTGFGAWSLSSTGTGSPNARHEIGDSTTLNPPNSGANINTSGESFSMTGFGTGNQAIAERGLTGDLSLGQTFSIDLAVNFRNGFKGFAMKDAGSEIFTLSVASDKYTVLNATTGNGDLFLNNYSNNTVFSISLEQTAVGGGNWTVTRSGGLTGSANGTYTGTPDTLRLFVGETSGNNTKTQDYLFANNIAVVPEPSILLISVAGFGLLGLRRKR